MKQYVADFETTVEKHKTRVWMWGYAEIGNVDNFQYGSTIDEFFAWCQTGGMKENKEIFFHNLKFDGEFIAYYLLTHGYEYSEKSETRTFNCVVDRSNQFYSITVIFQKSNKKYNKVVFKDSFKKLPFSVKTIGKSFGLPYQKMDVDEDFYKRPRGLEHVHTQEEIDYMAGDVKTVAAALGIQFDQDLTKMTIGGDSLHTYKKMLGGGDKKLGVKRFERDFPIVPHQMHIQLKEAYRGGYTYAQESKAGKDIKRGKVYDKNSMYPAVMKNELLPYGLPIYYEGKYEKNDFFPLYIQRLKCSFELKPGHLPMIQLKNGGRYKSTEYLKTSRDKLGNNVVDLVLTSVDLELFFDHYDVDVWEWKGGFMMKGARGMFDEYIDHFMLMKIANDENPALRAIAKLLLNNLYGKFGTDIDRTGKYPELDEKDRVRWVEKEQELDDPVYMPMAAFITAYARNDMVRSAQAVYPRFLYADTDSLHIEGLDTPTNLHIHKTELGAWKHEGDFMRGRYLRAKTYVEDICLKYVKDENGEYIQEDGKYVTKPCTVDEADTSHLHVVCAGMPDNVKAFVTWDNFHIGLTLEGKKMPVHVPGGIVLEDTTFSLS